MGTILGGSPKEFRDRHHAIPADVVKRVSNRNLLQELLGLLAKIARDRRCEIEFLAAHGVGGEAQPSAGGIARLIRQIKRENARVIFVENISGRRAMDQIARATGAIVGGTLYSDALSDASGPAPTYLDMMRHNTRLIAAGLRGQRP